MEQSIVTIVTGATLIVQRAQHLMPDLGRKKTLTAYIVFCWVDELRNSWSSVVLTT